MKGIFIEKSQQKVNRFSRQSTAIALALFFIFNQAVFPAFAQLPVPGNVQNQNEQPGKDPGEDHAQATAPAVPVFQNSTEFLLNNDSPLSKADDAELGQKAGTAAVSDQKTTTGFEVRDYSEYSFEDAVAQLSEDYASAVIVKSLSGDDLKKLTELGFETGLAVLKGKIVLFTSGTTDEIRVNRVAASLLEHADLVAHTHTTGDREEPSLTDISAAGANIEYVVTDAGIYAYSHDGLVQKDPYAYQDLAGAMNGLQKTGESSAETRDLLNRFILAIDEYNQDKTNYEIFRSADPITVFPNKPYLSTFASINNPPQTPGTVTLDQFSTSVFRLNYDVTNNGSFVGGVMNFGTAANLSDPAITKFTFGMITDNVCTGAVDCVKVEFLDSYGHLAAVRIQGLATTGDPNSTTFEQRSINKSTLLLSNPSLDFTSIKQINFVIDHNTAVNKPVGFLKIQTGGLFYQPNIPPSTANPAPAITKVPKTSFGTFPVISGFASADGSTSQATVYSKTFFSDALNLTKNTSYGGIYFSYDNSNTSGTIESANFQTAFPTGIVLQLDNGNTDITQAKLELTDSTGGRAAVMLTGIGQYGQVWQIDLSKFDGINLGAISTVALVAEGKHLNGKLNVDWGNFAYTPSQGPDPANPATTYLPVTSTQNYPDLTSFVTSGDTGSTTVFSQTFARIDLNLKSAGSYGGAYLDYDNKLTPATVETINLNSVFPAGIVLKLDNGGTALTQVQLEVTDINGIKDKVLLTGIGATGQTWKIMPSAFDDVDVTQIQTFAFVVVGVNANVKLNIDWGKFNFTGPDLTNPATTPLPATSTGLYPAVTGFASQGDPVGSDSSTSVATTYSQTFSQVNMNLALDSSYGGAFITYDDPNTTQKESFNFNTLFPNGVVFTLDNKSSTTGLATDLTQVYFELTDSLNRRAQVLLSDIKDYGQKYKLLAQQFVGIDLTKIITIAFVVKGKKQNVTLNIDWGNFYFVPSVEGTAYDASKHTNFYGTALVSANGGHVTIGSKDGTVTLVQPSSSEFTVNYDVSPAEDSFVFAQMGFGSSGLPMPAELVFGVRGPAGLGAGQKAQVKVEVVDKNNAVASFYLVVTNSLKNYTLSLAGNNLPAGFDLAHVKFINFVMDRVMSNNHYTDSFQVETLGLIYQPTINGSAYDASKQTNFYGTALVSANGGHVNTGSKDGTVTLVQPSSTEFTVNYDVSPATDSFVFATMDFRSVNPNGLSMPTDLVFGLRGPAGLGAGQTAQVKAEVVDVWGNKVVYYLNVTNALQNFTLSLTGDAKPPFFDRSHVTLINFVMDRVMSNNHYTDSFQVKTIGLIYQPSVDGTAYDASKFTDFDGVPLVSATGGHVNAGSKDGTVTVVQPNSTEFTVNYNVSPSTDSFVFAQMDFGAAGVSMDPSLVFALRGPTGLGAGQKAKVKAEVVDIWGNKAGYYLNVTNALQNFTLSLTGDARPPFFDLAHVQYINFVMDQALSNNHYVDSFQVKTLGLMYAAVVNAEDYDATKHTALPGYPSVSGTGGKVLSTSNPGTITINQTASDGFAALYDVSPSTDSFVFATVDFGSIGQALPSALVLGVRGPSWNLTSQVKVEVMDITGKKALFYLQTTKTLKNFTLNLSGDVLPAGFDLSHVGRINFVMDQTLSNYQYTNAFVVQTKGLLYTPELTGTAYDASLHTTLPGSPLVTGAGGKVNATSLPGTISISQSGSDGFAALYDVSPSADSFAFATIDFGASGQTLPGFVVMGLRGPSWGAAKVKVEFHDANGKKAIFYVNTTTALQNFTFALSGDVLPSGFDLSHIRFINFVMDQNLSNWQFVNSFVVQTKGLLYAPVIDGSAYDATAHTTLPGSPGVSASGGNVNPGSLPGTVSLVQASPSEFTVNYDVSPSEDSFVFAQIDFGSAGKTLLQDLIFGLRGPAGLAAGQKAQVKVEVVDINNKRAYYYLNVTNAAQNFHLVLAGDPLPSGFDLTHVQFVNFVVDQKLSNTHLKDSFKVNTKGLSFSGVVNGTAYDASKHTTLPSSPLPFVTGTGGKVEATSLPGTITIEQSASDGFAALYDVSKSPDSFVFATIDLGSAGQTLPSALVLGLRGPSWNPTSQVKVEVQDINGKKAVFHLNTTDALQNFTLNLSGDVLPAGFDLTHIQYIQFVMDQTLSNGQFVNSFVVQTKGLLYTPTLTGTAFDATAHTALPGSPVVVATGGKVNPGSLPGVVTVDQGSTKDFRVNYDVSPSEDSFIFSQIAFDTAGVTLPSVLVLGYQGPASGSSKVKVEVQDVNGKKATFYLNATEVAKNYTLNLSGDVLPAGFDLTKVQYITFVMDRGLSNNHYTGSFKVYTNGLTYVPRVTPLPAGDPSAITTLPLNYLGQRPALSPFASQDLSTATVTMQSQTQAQINLNLAAAGSYGGAYVSYDDFGTTSAVETADFSAAFPSGIVLELNNQFTSVPSVQFEVTDHTSSGDHKAVVILSGMAGTSQRWKILPSLLTGIDLTKVKSVALVVTGLQTNAILNVNWGNFAYTPSVTPDASNPAVTLVPVNYLGAKPVLNSFVSQGDIVNPDTSTVSMVQTSETFTTLDLNLKKDSSFGGMFINYNDPAATPPNSIDLSAAFPNGIVLGLDNAGTSLASVTFEVTDTSDKRDSVTLNGLTATEQKWKILASLFDEADIHHIKTLSLVVKGVNTNVKLDVDWGKFYVAPEISPLPSTTTATITPVPVNSLGNPPALQSFALNDGSAVSVDLSSASAGKINLNLVKAGSYGGVVVHYDNAATAGTVETIDINALFPTGIVLQLDNGGTDVTSVKLELKDSNGVTGAVILKSIDATARKWKIMPSSFSNVDLAHVESIALTAVGQHLNGVLNLVWGNYEYTPPSGGGSSGP